MKRMLFGLMACVLVTLACSLGSTPNPTETPEVRESGGNGGNVESLGSTVDEEQEEPPAPQTINIGAGEDIPDDVPEHLFFGGLGYVSGLFGCYDASTVPDTVEILQYPSGTATKRNCFCTDTNPGVSQVPATLTLPDGTVIDENGPVTEWEEESAFCAEFDYSFDSGMTMGIHRIEMNLGGQAINYEFMPVPGYLFYGYQPNEAVRLLLFTDGFGGEFIAERFVHADAEGNVYLQLTPDSSWPTFGGEPDKSDNSQYPVIVAFGETTACKIISPGYALNPNLVEDCNIELSEDEGNLVIEEPVFFPDLQPLPVIVDEWSPCKGAPSSRLQVGDIAIVSSDSALKLNIYSKPDANAKPLGQITSGEKVEVLDGPECAASLVFWYLRSFSQDLQGWSVEGDGVDYWLVPSQ
jgi:hypothetical protein